jgi:hypothetical protein
MVAGIDHHQRKSDMAVSPRMRSAAMSPQLKANLLFGAAPDDSSALTERSGTVKTPGPVS